MPIDPDVTPDYVVALILNQKLEVLAISRRDDPEDLGLIGGKVEPGEELLAAIRREVKEETSLDLLTAQPVFDHPPRADGKITRCYLVTEWSGAPVSVEGQRVEFVDKARLCEPSCSFADYNRRLFEEPLVARVIGVRALGVRTRGEIVDLVMESAGRIVEHLQIECPDLAVAQAAVIMAQRVLSDIAQETYGEQGAEECRVRAESLVRGIKHETRVGGPAAGCRVERDPTMKRRFS